MPHREWRAMVLPSMQMVSQACAATKTITYLVQIHRAPATRTHRCIASHHLPRSLCQRGSNTKAAVNTHMAQQRASVQITLVSCVPRSSIAPMASSPKTFWGCQVRRHLAINGHHSGSITIGSRQAEQDLTVNAWNTPKTIGVVGPFLDHNMVRQCAAPCHRLPPSTRKRRLHSVELVLGTVHALHCSASTSHQVVAHYQTAHGQVT